MLSFIKRLYRRFRGAPPAAARDPAAFPVGNTKEQKLKELCSRLTHVSRQDPLLVAGRAFLVEIQAVDPAGADAAEWEVITASVSSLLVDDCGEAGFVRRIAAGDFFLRYSDIFEPSGSMLSCLATKHRLDELAEKIGSPRWRFLLSAAVPEEGKDVRFRHFDNEEQLKILMDPFLREPDEGSSEVGIDDLSAGETPEPDELLTQSSPGWRKDDAWNAIRGMPEWRNTQKKTAPGKDDDSAGIVVPATEFDKVARSVASEEKKAEKLAKLQAEIEEKIDEVDICFTPVWDLRRKTVFAVHVLPAVELKNLSLVFDDDLFGRGIGSALSIKLDTRIYDTVGKARKRVDREFGLVLVVPVHVASVESHAGGRAVLASLIKLFKQLGPHDRLVANLVSASSDFSAIQLNAFAQLLGTVVDQVWIQFDDVGLKVDRLGRDKFSRIGLTVKDGVDDEKFIDAAGAFVDQVRRKGFDVFARGSFSRSLTQGLPMIGIELLCGLDWDRTLEDVVKKNRRFDLERFTAA
ncbi:MAG: hypothetical protein RIM72_21290 [Alphaproteobacteria bacterium]